MNRLSVEAWSVPERPSPSPFGRGNQIQMTATQGRRAAREAKKGAQPSCRQRESASRGRSIVLISAGGTAGAPARGHAGFLMNTPAAQNNLLKKTPLPACRCGFVTARGARERTTVGLAVAGSFGPYSTHEPARYDTTGQPIRRAEATWILARIYFPQ
jgi:hypothetical protein